MIIKKIMRLDRFLFIRKLSTITKETWESIMHDNSTTSLKRLIEDQPDVVEEILKNTEITREHLTPELKLFLLTDRCPLYYMPFIDNDGDRKFNSLTRNVFQDPFWSIYWPGGQVLTRFILDEKEKILGSTMKDSKKGGLRILDLGAGCGATAIAAKLFGAHEVVANDVNKIACVAIAMNAILNDVNIEVTWKNLLEQLPDYTYDVIFVGDLLYDEEIANILITWLENSYIRGARIYLGDPGRHGLTENLRKRLRLLRKYSLPEYIRKENHGYHMGMVWEFSPE